MHKQHIQHRSKQAWYVSTKLSLYSTQSVNCSLPTLTWYPKLHTWLLLYFIHQKQDMKIQSTLKGEGIKLYPLKIKTKEFVDLSCNHYGGSHTVSRMWAKHCIDFLGMLWHFSKTWWFKTTEMFSFTTLEARVLKTKFISMSMFPLKALGKTPALPLSVWRFLEFLHTPWLIAACPLSRPCRLFTWTSSLFPPLCVLSCLYKGTGHWM